MSKRRKKKSTITIQAKQATKLEGLTIFDIWDYYVIQSKQAGKPQENKDGFLNLSSKNHTVTSIFFDKKTGAPSVLAKISVKEAKALIKNIQNRLKTLEKLKKENKNIKGLLVHPSLDVCYYVGE